MVDNTKVDVLAEQLRHRIRKGEFGTNGRLPPHRVLAEQLHTTRETVNKVIQLLQSEGLLVAREKSWRALLAPVACVAAPFDPA